MRLLTKEETPSDWVSKKIGSYVLGHKGGAALRPNDFSDTGFPVIPKKAIQPTGELLIENPTYCTNEFASNNKRSIVDNSYTITTLRDLVPTGPTIGTVVNFTNEEKYILSQGVYGLKLNDDLDKKYLSYLSNTSFYRKVMQRIMVGSTQVHIRTPEYFDLEIQIPPLPEQQKIAKILSTWDKAISTTERLIENSTQQKKALMQQLLTGKKRLLDDEGKWFEGEWIFSNFEDLFKVANDKRTQVRTSDYLVEGSVPIVDQGKNMISGYTNNEGIYSDLPVIVFGDHTRVIKWVDFEFAQGADGTQVLKNMESLNSKFAYYLLSNADIPNLGYSRHMRELKEKDFKYPIEKEEQQKIATVLTNADKEIELLEQQLADLQQEKKALMQVLLTGKKRVVVEEETL